MELAIFNGSPRGKNSNTKVLIEKFLKGFIENNGEICSYDFLIQQKSIDTQVKHFKEAENIFLAFPLYTDSMPGIVKKFIETIGNFDGSGKRILFMVQSGFPEAIQSDGVKRYLELLTKRWQLQNMGIIIKPGAEGVRLMPEWMRKTLFNRMYSIGVQVATDQKVNENDLFKMAKPYTCSRTRIWFFNLMKLTGLTNLYWNGNLKKYKAFEKRFHAPYLNK